MPRIIKVEQCPDCPYVRTYRLTSKLVCNIEGKEIPRPVYPIGENKFPVWCPLEEEKQ